MSEFQSGDVGNSLAAAGDATRLASFWETSSAMQCDNADRTTEMKQNLPVVRQEMGALAMPEGLEAFTDVQHFVPAQLPKKGEEPVRRAIAVIGQCDIGATVYTQDNFAAFDAPIEAEFPRTREVLSFDGLVLNAALRKKWTAEGMQNDTPLLDTGVNRRADFREISVGSLDVTCMFRRQAHRRRLDIINGEQRPALEIDLSYAEVLDQVIAQREASRTDLRPVRRPII